MSRTYEQLEPVITALDERIGAKSEQIATNTEDIGELKNTLTDVKEDLTRLGYDSSVFNYTGVIHSATKDKIFLDVSQGDTFIVYIKHTVPTTNHMYLYGYNGNNDNNGTYIDTIAFTNYKASFVASSDFDSFGLTVEAGTGSGTVAFCIIKADSIALDKSNNNEFHISEMSKYGKAYFDRELFQKGSLYNGELVSINIRICSYPAILKYPYDLHLLADTGFRFGVHTYNSENVFVRDSGWQTDYIIPANTPFRIVIGKSSDETTANVFDYINKVSFLTNEMEAISKLTGNVSYYYDGEPIDFKQKGFDVISLFSVPSIPTGAETRQAFAINNGVLFQLYNADKIKLVDFTNGNTITTLDIKSDHGDSINFSNEFYDSNDEFPLAFITADSTPAKVYVNRITRSSATLIKTYYFGDVSKTGYFAGHCLDADNNILYMVGYTESSYRLDEHGTNRMIVSKWDLNNCTVNDDTTLTPAFISSFTTPFIKTAQGQQLFDNKLFILSSHWGTALEHDTKVVVIDPFKEKIITIMNSFPSTIKEVECEGIDFVLNTNTHQYDMIISGNSYYKLAFN